MWRYLEHHEQRCSGHLWVKATLQWDSFPRQPNSLAQNRSAYVAFRRKSMLAAFQRVLLHTHMWAMDNHECLSTNWPITSWILFFHVIFQITFQSKKKKKKYLGFMISRILFVESSNTSESHFTKFEHTVVSVKQQATGNVGLSNSWNTRLPSPPTPSDLQPFPGSGICLFIIHRLVLCARRCN